MCHYCHVLKNNPTAPPHPGVRCLDRGNTHSQVPLAERTYNQGQSLLLRPSAPPAEEQNTGIQKPQKKKLFSRFLTMFKK